MTTNSPQNELVLRRYEIIVGLLAENLDRGIRARLLKVASETANVNVRTIHRWIAAYKQFGLNGLMPSPRNFESRDSSVTDDIVDYAIMLRREVPERSVSDIIRIMELEHFVEEGQVKRSTLQDHLERRGFGRRQLGYYLQGSVGAARRFERTHRNELWQADIKYLLVLPASNGKPKRQVYTSAFIDDATRLVTGLKVYEHQTVHCVLDCFQQAIERYGVPNELYVDNGKQYTSKGLRQVCANLGIRLMHAKPYAAASKGKIEAFNKFLDKFVAESRVAEMKLLEDVQRALDCWLDVWYQQKPHSAFNGKLSPREAYNQDPKEIRRIDAQTLTNSFAITDDRIVDKTGCLSFNSRLWEAGTEYVGLKVSVRYSPYSPDTLIVSHRMFEDKEIYPVNITPYCRGRNKPQPLTNATHSRMLDLAEQCCGGRQPSQKPDIGEQPCEERCQTRGATCFTDFISDRFAGAESTTQSHTSNMEGGQVNER